MSEQVVGNNKAVFFTYTVTDESGKVCEQNDFPVGYIHGAGGDIVEKLEQGMQGHKAGDKLEITLSPEEGFGPVDPTLILQDRLKNVPPQFHKIGTEVDMKSADGQVRQFLVTRIKKGRITFDGNHPYAGKTVTFNITITEVRDATPEECQSGQPMENIPRQLH